MSGILSITGTIFVLIGLGYALVRTGILDRATIGGLSRFVVTVALPALIIDAFSTRDLAELIDPVYLAAYLAGSLATLALGYAASRRLLGVSQRGATFASMGMACSNSGYVGYPILAIAMPSLAGTALALNMMVENFVMIPLVLAMAERAASGGGRGLVLRIARRLATNPILIAIVLGVALSLMPFDLPGIVAQSIGLVAQSATGLALVVIGGSLVGLPFRRVGRQVPAIVGFKLVVHPLAVAAAFAILGALGLAAAPDLARAAIIMAAMPAMGIYPLLAAQYGEGEEASAAMLAMTVAAFFTLSALLWLLTA